MEQQYNINSTFDKMSLIHNIPVQFSINNRRLLEFKFPTIKETLQSLDFKMFLGAMKLTPEEAKKQNIAVNFKVETIGDIIQILIVDKNYAKILVPFLLKYIKDSEYKENSIFVNNEKVMSYELDYIISCILISLSQKEFEKNEEKIDIEKNPILAKIQQAQKESEEKLKKAKQKKSKGNLTIEEIMLAVTYEFGINQKDLLDSNYFSLIWYFGYVGKVDGHKLNQMILSSGLSKQKNYSYWLNK